LSIDLHGAGAALRGIAADMRAGKANILPDQVDQQFAGLDRDGSPRAVDVEFHGVTCIGIRHNFSH
jgi:hypothetical protein